MSGLLHPNPLVSSALTGGVRPGCPPVTRHAASAGPSPRNYQLQGPASTPGAGQTGNELSPLGRTSGWLFMEGAGLHPPEVLMGLAGVESAGGSITVSDDMLHCRWEFNTHF